MFDADGIVSLYVDCLVVVQCCTLVYRATTFYLMCSTAESFSVVNIYHGDTGTWSIAQLSDARCYLAAASVGNVALFAGGFDGAY